jgi:membrane dipeptidase
MIGVENGFAIGQELKKLREFYELGARYITLTHNGHNDICDSSIPREALGDKKTEHNGLSNFGREVIAEMNRLGMMCDASHISDESFFELIEASKAPIIVSHSSCRALAGHPRNLTDEQLVALARKSGVIQITAVKSFLRPASGVEADVRTFVDHIEHVVKLVGIDYVGIGSDFDGGGGIEGFNDHCEAPNVTIELVRRGYSEEDICKIWSGNFLRVWREVEAIAKEL